jgi:hypothetical protein
MEKRLSVILACLFLCVGMVLAQNKISGTVVSAEDGEPVIGASVMIQGTKVGTVTDIDGNFTLSANRANPMLEISYIGMVTQKVKGSSNMKIRYTQKVTIRYYILHNYYKFMLEIASVK